MAGSEQEVLVARLARYAADRYPVQHATTQFHLGSVLLQRGEPVPAERALSVARAMFADAGMSLEHAKATVMLGVALRTSGQLPEASAAFTEAGCVLGALGQPAEQAAAYYNLGLVRQDCADLDGAHVAWVQACALFLEAGYPAQAAAAARDHGASLLSAGQIADALPLLEQALSLADLAGHEPGVGAAANALGLAQLTAGQPAAAVGTLRRAVAAFPRTVRPADHAMAKANLALAHERAGDAARARLAAGQALAVSSAAAPVRAQARALLARQPAGTSQDVLVVLDSEPRDQWVAVVREEVLRALELAPDGRCAVLSALLDGVLARPDLAYDLAESLVHVVLELPPRPYALVVTAVVEACSGRPAPDTDRLSAVTASALARFALPQWQRLVASLNAAAKDAGQPARWR